MSANITSKVQETDFVLQPNAISQAMYSLGTNARRLVAMAMSLVPDEENDYTVTFSLLDFITTLGLKDGQKTRLALQAAAEECMGNLIKIHKPNDDYELFTWFDYAKLSHYVDPAAATGLDRKSARKLKQEMLGPSKPWDTITMQFNPKLGEAIKQFKKAYAKISLADLGKLQSRYAIRFYELALSYAGFAGKDGNKPGEWYFKYTVAELRALFQIPNSQYKITGNFRTKIVDLPIAEINQAGIGLEIKANPEKQGRRLAGFHFNCRFTSRNERNVTPIVSDQDEAAMEEALIAAYPDEFKKYYDFDMTQQELFPHPFGKKLHARQYAIEKLKAAHPDFISNWRKNHGGKK